VTPAQPTSGRTAEARTVVIEDEAALEPYLDAWDGLAVACERPFCAPAWLLAWWREERSGDARLRVAIALEEDRVIGVAPFFAQVSYGLNELRLLAAGFSHRIGLLAEPGKEEAVARVLAPALATIDPPPASVVFEGIDSRDRWPELLAAAWPGRTPRLRTDATMEAPEVDLGDSYDAWMEGRARKFRKEARRNARRLEEAGVQSRIGADREAIAALIRLHEARWEDRGGSEVGARAERVVAAAAERLGDEGRLEVILLESEDGPVSAELVLRAGGVAVFWAGGFDPAWSRHAPGTQTMLVALRSAAERGVKVADLGGGAHSYKLRMADGSRPIVWRTLFPRGRRYPLIRLRLAPKHLKYGLRRLAKRLPEPIRERLARIVQRG
jgi:CelD/BcsL family acetyltransferase involved in cellulose biosynthesis